MKIKHRLFISNLLMLVIPFAASVLVAYTIVFIFFRANENPVERSFPQALNIIGTFQRTEDLDGLLESVGAFNSEFGNKNVLMAVAREGRFVYPENAGELISGGGEALLTAMMSDEITGNMYVNGIQLLAERSGEYRILLVDMEPHASAYKFSGRPTPSHLLIILGIFIFIIIATNRILTRLLTKSIIRPLDTLTNGVHELRDGNLEYRLNYKYKDEFAPVCDDFNEMAEHLQSLIESRKKDEESRKELLAGISHDLRTPLTSIKAYVEGLLDGVARDYPTQLKYLGVIRQKAEDIDSIVDKLFLFSKLDIGEFPFYNEKLDIGSELSSMVSRAGEEYAKKGLRIELAKNLPDVYVYADPVQLRGAITNIFENSANYKNKTQGSIAVECFNHSDIVEIHLTDDGPGVPDESLGKLFDVFYRGDPSRNNPSKGSGLGLAITSRVMRLMGGSVRAENAERGGLRMILTVPKYSAEEIKNEKNPDC